ncbi:Granzyme A [Merluccius polli]|uniref:Granzyme A n=1 Tax=Merluccius polli TaxID=89951 RepID=A0AA47NS63_MERPO|nr:Granzyme A [Merluccius polli]
MACSCLALFKTICLVLLYVQSCVCGETEILGGKEVKAHSMPYMVLLLNRTGQPVCGGTLLSSRWVLTAAHCLRITAVRLGVHSIKKSQNYESVQVQTYPHPKYDSGTFNHDLQLLKLNQKVEQNNTVKYLPLADPIADPLEGTTCLVAGWGLVDNTTNTMSDVLKSAEVDVMGRETCNSSTYWKSQPVITPDMVCAGPQGKNEDQDTCKGDSGGPLLCNGVQVGVTSFGVAGCRRHKKPGVYTFLSKQHIEWINKTMGEPALHLSVVLCLTTGVCGETEIFGGKEVKDHSMPYMVLLLNSTGQPVCGGTLLSSRWVLTAAHCTDNPCVGFFASITEVRLGVDSFKKSQNDESVQVQKDVKTYPHPEYDNHRKVHDLQLLKVS